MSASDRKKSSTVRNIWCFLTDVNPCCKVISEQYPFHGVLSSYLEAATKKAPQKGAFVVFDGCYIKTVILIFLPFQIRFKSGGVQPRLCEEPNRAL